MSRWDMATTTSGRMAILVFALAPVCSCAQKTQESNSTPIDPSRHIGDGRIYNKNEQFSIVPPNGWSVPSPLAPHAFMTFAAPKNEKRAKENFLPNLNVISVPSQLPLEELRSATKEELTKNLVDFSLRQDGLVTIDGTNAYFIVYDGIPSIPGMTIQWRNHQYVFRSKKSDKYFVVTFTSLPSQYDDLHKAFEESANTIRVD
jgi:hypothetical protein